MRVDSLTKSTADVPCDFAAKYDDFCRQFHLLPLSSVKIKLDSGIIDLDTDTLRYIVDLSLSSIHERYSFPCRFDDWTPLCSAIGTCKTLRSLTLRSQYYNSSSNNFAEGLIGGRRSPEMSWMSFSWTTNIEASVICLETTTDVSVERTLIEDLYAYQRLSSDRNRIGCSGTRWSSISTKRSDDSSAGKRWTLNGKLTLLFILLRALPNVNLSFISVWPTVRLVTKDSTVRLAKHSERHHPLFFDSSLPTFESIAQDSRSGFLCLFTDQSRCTYHRWSDPSKLRRATTNLFIEFTMLTRRRHRGNVRSISRKLDSSSILSFAHRVRSDRSWSTLFWSSTASVDRCSSMHSAGIDLISKLCSPTTLAPFHFVVHVRRKNWSSVVDRREER